MLNADNQNRTIQSRACSRTLWFLDRLMFGPFSDATGGTYVTEAGSQKEAAKLGHADPLVVRGSSELIIKEWKLK
ncbi:ycii-related domain superfamily [Bacillus tequilensis]|nr:ycii-related domain superfamily [Bacillus tequilensis]